MTAPRGDRAALAAWVEAEPDDTGAELAGRLADERGVRVSARTVNRVLAAMGLTRKKRPSEPVSGTGPT